jgi:hypothetical protein
MRHRVFTMPLCDEIGVTDRLALPHRETTKRHPDVTKRRPGLSQPHPDDTMPHPETMERQ